MTFRFSPQPKRATERGQILVRGRAHAIVVARDLVRAGLVERLKQPPDIGLVCFRGAVAGAVGEDNDVPCRDVPLPYLALFETRRCRSTLPQSRTCRAVRHAPSIARSGSCRRRTCSLAFSARWPKADGVDGAHCIHELWMRGEFPQNIERALERLWQSAAKTVPEWLPMRYVSWLPLGL